jgi:hypothetical protein
MYNQNSTSFVELVRMEGAESDSFQPSIGVVVNQSLSLLNIHHSKLKPQTLKLSSINRLNGFTLAFCDKTSIDGEKLWGRGSLKRLNALVII